MVNFQEKNEKSTEDKVVELVTQTEQLNKDKELLQLFKTLIETNEKITNIISEDFSKKIKEFDEMRIDISHFLELEEDNLTEDDFIYISKESIKLSKQRRVCKNINSVKSIFESITSYINQMNQLNGAEIDTALDSNLKNYHIRNDSSLDILKKISTEKENLHGKYNASSIKKSIIKKEVVEQPSNKIDIPVPFKAKTLATVEKEKEKLEKEKKAKLVNDLPKVITKENIDTIISTSNSIKELDEVAEEEKNKRPLTTEEINKVLKQYKISRQRRRSKRR